MAHESLGEQICAALDNKAIADEIHAAVAAWRERCESAERQLAEAVAALECLLVFDQDRCRWRRDWLPGLSYRQLHTIDVEQLLHDQVRVLLAEIREAKR